MADCSQNVLNFERACLAQTVNKRSLRKTSWFVPPDGKPKRQRNKVKNENSAGSERNSLPEL